MSRKLYTREFKLKAVELANEGTKPVAQVARELNISKTNLYSWISKYSSHGEDGFINNPQDDELRLELRRLKAENSKLKEEREILKKAAAWCVHHSDRGSQYCSDAYQLRLIEHGLVCSMSGSGNCYDNAVMESFYHSLKVELIHNQKYATREEAQKAIFDYIEVFYNRQRLHSSLGYKSPEEFEMIAA